MSALLFWKRGALKKSGGGGGTGGGGDSCGCLYLLHPVFGYTRCRSPLGSCLKWFEVNPTKATAVRAPTVLGINYLELVWVHFCSAETVCNTR